MTTPRSSHPPVWSSTLPTGPPSAAPQPAPEHPPLPPAGSPPPPFPPHASPQPARNGGGDRSRAGARWITATGAFLLLAAATVFVAVRWQELSDEVKLGILAALTGGFLFAGRRTREALPATSGVLYHLGAFLVPLNTAAVAIGRDLAWAPFLLLEGVTATAVWFVLERVERSSILRWATNAAAVVALVGSSASLEHQLGWTVPAAVLVALAALAADRCGRHDAAVAWAAVAGLAPLAALAEAAVPLGTDVVVRLGLAGDVTQRAALASGLVSAYVLARAARRRQDLVLVVASALAAGLGALTAFVGLAPSASSYVLAAAGLFLVVELGAQVVRRDPLWGPPARVIAIVVEVLAAMAMVEVVGHAVGQVASRSAAPRVVDVVAGGLVTVAWFVADLRRRSADGSGVGVALLVGAGWWPATVGMTAAALLGVAAGTGSGTAVAITAAVVAGLLVLSGRTGGHLLAVGLSATAPLVAAADGAAWYVVVAVGVAGSLVVAGAAVVRARVRQERLDQLPAWGLALATVAPVLLARCVVELIGVADRASLVATVLSVVTLWLVAAVLDLGEVDGDTAHLGLVARVGVLLAVATGLALPPSSIAVVAGVAAALAILDAVRREDAVPLWGLLGSLPLAVATAAYAVDGATSAAGLALCGLAATATGAELLAPDRYRPPLVTLAGVSGLAALVLCAPDLASFSTVAILLGGVGLAASTAHRVDEGLVFAWTLVTIGVWGHLAHAEIEALDAYVAPVAIALAAVGVRAMRVGAVRVSSWIAFGPAIAVLGGAALFERIDGGGGIHAVVAGSIGVAAVILGGWRRFIAPLLLGTVLLVTLTVHESLGVTRQVPTWAWLALGGTVLVTVGAMLDRKDRSPLETGRRLVDVVHERFS